MVVGLGLALLVWVLSALVLSYILGVGSVSANLFYPFYKPPVLLMRLLILGVILGLTFYSHATIKAMAGEREKYRSAMEAAAEPFVVYDQEGKVTYVNLAFTRVFGWSAGEVRGRRLDFVPPEEWPKTQEQLQRLLQGETISSFQTRRQTKAGRVIDVEISAAPYRDHQGEVLGVIANLRDISQRKEVERVLEESEQVFRGLADTAPFGISIMDPQGDFEYLNSKFREVFGYTLEDIPDKESWFQKAYPDPAYREQVSSRCRAAFEQRHNLSQTFRVRCKDGSDKQVHFQTMPLPDGRLFVTYEDITDRIKAEQALAQSEALYRVTFESTPDAITISRLEDGRYLAVNDSFCSITGYRRQEVLGRTPHELELFADPRDREEMVRRLRQEGVVSGLDVRFRMKDGRVLDTILGAKRFTYQDQDCLVAVVQDVTEKRRLARERAQLEAQLYQAQKVEALGVLAGGVAHDFNNLLQAATGYLYLLGLEKDEAKRNEYHRQISRIMQSGAAVVQRLLTFGRKLEPRYKLMDLNRIVRDSLDMLERTIPRMVKINTCLAGQDLPLRCDPAQMEQVLINLVTNAVDAMDQGGRLDIRTGTEELKSDSLEEALELREGRYLVLEVADTGCGMDQETRDRIFDPFFTTKKPGRGTGLGMSTVYGIIRSHQGYITCRSQPGRGTRFRIYLPLAERAAGVEEEAAGAGRGGERAAGGGETILLVDDEPAIRESVRLGLEQSGYRVLSASSGEQALSLYARRTAEIDLVILDVSMPGIGGIRCLQGLLALDPAARVMMASGYLDEELKSRALAIGALDYLRKPYDINALLDKIGRLIPNLPV